MKKTLEVDILTSQTQNHVSYITKKPKTNKVCGCMLQNKGREMSPYKYS